MGKIKIAFSDSTEVLADLLKPYPAVFAVADRKVRRNVAGAVTASCARAGVNLKAVLYIRASERNKTLRSVLGILRWLTRKGADRNALVLAIGGGVTTDLAGFAACIYKRGVKYANVPTTLLSQVDAAIGGKTGCNVDGLKNMAGVVRQPEFTFINRTLAATLPRKEYTAGMAELLKTFIIGDAQAYEEAVECAHRGRPIPEALIRRAVEIKSAIVERDEFETGERRLLNLGHTFAHAIECRSARCLFRRALPGERSLSGLNFGRISHGHAVAMGMIMAARLSEERGLAAEGLADRLADDFAKAGLETRSPWTAKRLRNIIRKDKKSRDGKIDFVLIREIGRCETVSIPV